MATLGKNQVFEIKNGDGTSFYNLVLRKSAVESIVMSLGDKISGDVYYKDNSLSVTMHEYITYNGVNYMLVNPPTIVREGIVSDNSELKGMTKYSFVFYHPMCQLANFPFLDVAVTSDETRYLSESKTFSWIGKPADFVAKLNKNLTGTEWIVEISSRFPQDKLDELSSVIPFDNATIADACKTFYDTWGVPYIVDKVASTETSYAAGKRFKIVMGLPSNEIYASATAQQQNTPYVFQMGHGVGLKNNSRTPRNNKIITRISGYGSENNIPYGYPQVRWYGTAGQSFTYGDHAGVYTDVTIGGVHFDKVVSYPIYKGILNGEYVELIKHPFTRTHLMPSVYRTTLFNKISLYNELGEVNTDYDPDITLVDFYDAVYSSQYPYPNTINLQAPSYESHEFEDEKPELGEAHIISATPLNNDLTPASSWDDSLDDEGNYKQSYFQMVLPQLSFDLYACASITEEMQINMRSGACLGCTFTVQVDWDDYKRNFYDEEGNFAPNGSQRDLTKYPKSNQGSISLVLQKDNSTFGTLMPNMYQYPKGETSTGANDGDTFVILGISLPESYILAAELRLDADMKSYMLENNVHYFDYPLKFDEDFLFHNENILSQIRPNTVVRFNYAGQTQALFVKQITIKYGEQVLPQYDITLTDNVEVVLNQIGQVAEDVEKLSTLIAILRQSYGKSVWNELAKKLSKTQDDTAAGYITMLKGLQIGANFVPDILGEGGCLRMRDDGKVELVADILYARMRAYFDSVVIREYRHESGNRIKSPAQGFNASRVENIKVVDNVETIVEDASEADFFRCYWRVDDGEKKAENQFIIGDLAFCEHADVVNGSLVTKRYWRVVVGRNAGNTTTADGEAWIDLSNAHDANGNPVMTTISWEGQGGVTQTLSVRSFESSTNGIPEAHDDICMLGCTTDTTRQGAIIEYVSGVDAPTYQIYQGLGSNATNPYVLTNRNQISFGYNSSTGKAYMNVYGDTYIGDKNRSTFLEYKQDDGTPQHKPVFNIKAKVQILPNGSTIDGQSIPNYIKENQNNYDDSEVKADIALLDATTQDLQKQIDGAIETYYMVGEPSLNLPPVVSTEEHPYDKPWLDGTETPEERTKILNNHIGDLYYDKATNHGYRFMYDNEEEVYLWSVLTDEDVTEALRIASEAQETADGKRTIYSVWGAWMKNNVNTLEVGDLFIPAANTTQGGVTYKANKVYKCTTDGSATFQAADYIDDAQAQAKIDAFVSNTYNPDKINLQSQIDGKAETFRQATDPSLDWYVKEGGEVTLDVRANHVGDLWMDISANGGKKTYIYEDNGESADPRYEWKAQEVPDEVFDEIDGKSTIFGNAIATPPTDYKKDDMWLLPAAATINGVSYKAGEVLSASQDSKTYSAAHWSKKIRYTDDSAFNGYIDEMLNGSHTSGSSSIIAAATQRAIMNALGGSTIIDGGLMLTSMIALRQNTGTAETPQYTTWAGISGVYDAQARGAGIAAWYGGAKADMEDMTDAQQTAWDALTPEQKVASSDWAKIVNRFDGSGYLASKNIRWTADGKVYLANIHSASGQAIDDYFFEAFAIGIDGTTRYINPAFSFSDIDIVRRSGASYTITGTSVLNRNENDARYMVNDRFKDLFRVYNGNSDITDSFFTNGLPSDTSNVSIKAMFDFWSQGGITALGQGSGGGGGGGGATTLYGLNDVSKNATGDGVLGAADGYVLTYNASTSHWYAAPTAETYVLPTATAAALGGIKIGYTTSGKNYAVQLANGQAFVNVPWTDTTYSFSNADATLAWSTRTKIATTGGTDIYVTMPANPDTNTWRNIFLSGAEKLTTGINTKGLNFVGDGKTTISFLAAGTGEGQSGNADYATLKISSTWRGIQDNLTSDSTTDSLSAKQGKTLKGYTDTLFGYFTSGVANSAAKLATARSLWGNSFDGTSGITSSIIISTPKVNETEKYLQIGGIKLVYDATNEAIYVVHSDDAKVANFYAQGGVSALGSASGGGGGGGGVDMEVVWANLAAATSEQINASHLSTALSGYATQSWVSNTLSPYATQSWVGQQGFLTSIAAATASALGGIKVGYTTSGKNYKVQLDSSNNAYVNVPWENTTYTLAGLMGSSAKGSTTQPIYWTGSAFANTSYTLGKSVPSDAVFTDHYAWSDITGKPLTLTKNTTGFSISGGTTSKTLTVSESYTLGAACAKSVTDNSSNADVTSTDTNLITGRTLYYQLAKKGYTTNTGTVTSVATGTGLTGGTITTSGTISINSTYQTYISHGESAYNSLGNYLLLSGGTMTGSITMSQGASARNVGIVGTYDYTKAAAIWCMGSSYQIKSDGSGLGSLYGAAYVYQSQAGQGVMGGSHQFVWGINGTAEVALGEYVWARNGFKKKDSSDSYVLLGGGGHAAISGLSVSYASSAGTSSSCSGNAANVTGTVAVGHGGTGATTAAGARANLGTWALISDSYDTLIKADGSTNGWIKIGKANSDYGIIPSQSGGAGSGHNYIGTSSWYWKYAYIDQIYGYLNGSISGSSTSCSGNAASATKLQTSRTIWGQSFNGTGNVDGLLKITANSNTTTIGSQNSSWCHIYNSADINFIFNHSVYTIGSIIPYQSAYDLGSSSSGYRWGTAYVTGVNCTTSAYFCTSSGNCGIGTSSPSYKLDVSGSIRSTSALVSLGIDFLSVGSSAGHGGYIDFHYNGSSADYTSRFIESSSGTVTLHGNFYASGGVTCSSDIRLKDVLSYQLPLTVEQVAQAPTIKFLWKNKREEGEQVGSIAQYWQKVLPQSVSDKSDELGLSYGVAALISAITTARKVVDHEREIAQLKNRVKALEDENKMLKTKLIA